MRALVFPGQGSQAVGMGRDLHWAHALVRDTYDEASAALGYDIAGVSFEGPAERLAQTDIMQPALLVNSVAVLRLLQERGLCFEAALGHSLGEYSALVAVGALGFAGAVELVRRRGEAMHAAARQRPGGMAAVIGLDDAAVEQVCAGLEGVWTANFNCPGQVVVSGGRPGLEEIEKRALAAGARRVVRLAVSGAFHSPFMRPAARELGAALREAAWSAPSPRFFSVCSVEFEDGGLSGRNGERESSFPELLTRQVTAPVRFTQSIRRLQQEGFDSYLEVGPGNVLGGLIRRIAPEAAVARAGDLATLEQIDGEVWLR